MFKRERSESDEVIFSFEMMGDSEGFSQSLFKIPPTPLKK
jgi:hypothetical protein